MSKRYRLGVAGLVHDHVWGELQHWAGLDNVDIVAAADPNPPLLEKIKEQHAVGHVYSSWAEMLATENLDVLQVAATNAGTADIVEAAAARGIHIISEKPMAARLAQANRMLAASEKHGIHLMINWPNAWGAPLNTMLRLISDGAIGQPVYFKYRAAHNGPKEIGCSPYFWGWLYDEAENGAGALMDYCCYSADMSAFLFGLPHQVTGIRAVLAKDYPLPDDNAIILMKYDRTFCSAEASWTQPVSYPEPNPICHGTGGCIYLWHGSAWIQEVGSPEPRQLEPDLIPAHRANGPRYLLHCIETGEPIDGLCSARVGRDAQEILEAGLISSNTGEAVEIPIALE